MVQVVTERVVINNLPGPCRKVVGITGVKDKSEMPSEYVNTTPRFERNAVDRDGVMIKNNKGIYQSLRIGEVVTESDFQSILATMKSAAARLAGIKRDRRELAASWAGAETFCL